MHTSVLVLLQCVIFQSVNFESVNFQSVIFQSCKFHPLFFAGRSFSTPANSSHPAPDESRWNCAARSINNNNNNNIHICIAPYGRNFRGAKVMDNTDTLLPLEKRWDWRKDRRQTVTLRGHVTMRTSKVVDGSKRLVSCCKIVSINRSWTKCDCKHYVCGMPKIQYSPRSARLSVHKLFTSCIRRGLVSHDSTVDDDWFPATEWCQRYLQCCRPASDVAENLGRFLVQSVQTRGMTVN